MSEESDYWDSSGAAVRKRLVSAARVKGIPADDAEDVAQEALLKSFRKKVGTKSPKPEVWALATLRDTRAEYWRKAYRRRDHEMPWPDGSEDNSDHVDRATEAAFELAELAAVIENIAGRDAMEFALLKSRFGLTSDDIGRRPGWNKKRAEAARIRFARKKEAIARAIVGALDQAKEV